MTQDWNCNILGVIGDDARFDTQINKRTLQLIDSEKKLLPSSATWLLVSLENGLAAAQGLRN